VFHGCLRGRFTTNQPNDEFVRDAFRRREVVGLGTQNDISTKTEKSCKTAGFLGEYADPLTACAMVNRLWNASRTSGSRSSTSSACRRRERNAGLI